jgi:hypothetical protein
MATHFRVLIGCCAVMMAALLVVGAVSHGVLRHAVQTAPLWIVIALALRKSPAARWAAVPCFAIWLVLMSAIWLFLLGWTRLVSGTFSPVEIAMTLIVGSASAVGIAAAVRGRAGLRPWPAIATVMLLAAVQLGAFRVSVLPGISRDPG